MRRHVTPILKKCACVSVSSICARSKRVCVFVDVLFNVVVCRDNDGFSHHGEVNCQTITLGESMPYARLCTQNSHTNQNIKHGRVYHYDF